MLFNIIGVLPYNTTILEIKNAMETRLIVCGFKPNSCKTEESTDYNTSSFIVETFTAPNPV